MSNTSLSVLHFNCGGRALNAPMSTWYAILCSVLSQILLCRGQRLLSSSCAPCHAYLPVCNDLHHPSVRQPRLFSPQRIHDITSQPRISKQRVYFEARESRLYSRTTSLFLSTRSVCGFVNVSILRAYFALAVSFSEVFGLLFTARPLDPSISSAGTPLFEPLLKPTFSFRTASNCSANNWFKVCFVWKK